MTSPAAIRHDTYYHIYNRGINREDLFYEDRNYEYFLKLSVRHLLPVADIFAYCLLRNHFHMLIRVKSKSEIAKNCEEPGRPSAQCPSQKFADLFNAYAKTINHLYGRTGSLFAHPFRRVTVYSQQYFWNAMAYIHQNPQKHGLVDDFREWKWSSFAEFAAQKSTKLNRASVQEWFGGQRQFLRLHGNCIEDQMSGWPDRDP
jgi:putative transposase